MNEHKITGDLKILSILEDLVLSLNSPLFGHDLTRIQARIKFLLGEYAFPAKANEPQDWEGTPSCKLYRESAPPL